LSFLFFIFMLLFMIRDIRIRGVFIFLFFWEYLLYANTIIRIPTLSFLFVYLIIYSYRTAPIRHVPKIRENETPAFNIS
jgi:hypothetical protein